MKQVTLKLAVLSALSAISMQSYATGFVNLPTTGFPVSGGTSAYTLCNTTGNFGSGITTKPTPSANNTCAVFPSSEIAAPETGFSFVASASRPVVMNNIYTGNTNKTVGTVTEYVWRRQTGSTYECIYGAKVVNNSTDYNTIASGNQYFEVNGIARGGFAGLPVDVAYSTIPVVSDPVYRIGRAYTSVQHRSSSYAAQPLTGLGSYPSINGLNSYPGTASPTQQLADIHPNWVEFTTDVNFLDDDGSSVAASGMVYVKTTCSSAAPSTSEHDEAIRLRQTFQELSGDGITDNPFIEVKVRGFVPPGGSITPAHTDPY
ncbi:hypothetical protein [Methylobacillus flagellatus]|nr:hypothetical protein [Methylobacillus flagellatus]